MVHLINPIWLLPDDAFRVLIKRTGVIRGAKATNVMLQRVKQLKQQGKTREEIHKITGLHPRTIRLYLNS